MYGDCQVVLSSMGMNNNCSNSSSSSNQNLSNMNMNMNMNMFSSDSAHHYFSSPPNNNNFNFMSSTSNGLLMPPLPFQQSSYPPFNIHTPKEESTDQLNGKFIDEMESGSGSDHIEAMSVNDPLDNNNNTTDQNKQPPAKKKRYHRHTPHQIQEMEAVFKECPHPDDKQRMRLSHELGLKPRQIKFWFQNRRTQMKAQHDRQDNVMLRQENENLMNENYRLQAALRNIVCPNCGGPAILNEVGFDEQQLRIENARLKEELERVCNLASNYSGRPVGLPPSVLAPSLDLEMSMYPRHFQEPTMGNCSEMMMPPHLLPENAHFNDGVMIMEEEKDLALELAISAVDELTKMCRVGQPLWCQCKESGKEVLNAQEYSKMFPWAISNGSKPNSSALMRTEATRESSVVIMNSITLVDAFMNCSKWIDIFPSIVLRARTVQVLTPWVPGNANASLQLMQTEFQFLSPLVPTRELYFLRYCQQDAEEGTWVIVDFPIDNFQNNFQSAHLPVYKRRPSGCVIQDMPNGYSRVTWVEHSEIEDMPVHQIFNNIVSHGLAFGAERWLNVLQRQCERLASLMAQNIPLPDLGVISSPEARQNLMKLAHRMIRTFCVNISTSNGQSWTALSDSSDDTLRITTRKVMEPGQPTGVILSAVSTTWLPHSHYQVFDLLRDEHKRAQIDVLSNGNSLHEVAHIANGSHPGNCISLLRINVASNSSQNVELMLQESCIDQSGCLIVHANIDVDSIQLAMSGEDPSCIPLLPIGFVITPVVPHKTSPSSAEPTNIDPNISSPAQEPKYNNSGGCLLTVGLQVLASSLPSAKLSLSSITAANDHLCKMVHQISLALGNVSNAPAIASSSAGAGVDAQVTADQA
ncbi:unnamed protein product [Rhodiola kirilowii]